MKTNKVGSFLQRLISNTLIIGVGSSLSKILLFLLIPVLTRNLSTEEYGNSEIIIDTINLAIPIFTIVIFEAILRYTLDNNCNKTEVFSIGLKITFKGAFVLFIIVFISQFFFEDSAVLLTIAFFIYLCTAFKQCFLYYARGLNKFTFITCISIIEGVLLLVLVVVLVAWMSGGIVGYLLSILISYIISIIIYCVGLKVNFFECIKTRQPKLEFKMVRYSLPMIFNSLGWWINNISDRYMLAFMDSMSITGIYSVAYKIPGLLNTVVDVFMQAWKVVATSEFENGKKNHYVKGFNLFVYASIAVCSILMLCIKWFSGLFLGTDYLEAWRYSIILVIAFLFNGISGYIGTVFTALKSTKHIGTSTCIGAATNILLNVFLIKYFSAMGAAVATCISAIVVCGCRLILIKKHFDRIKFNWKIYLLFVAMVICSFLIVYELSLIISIILCTLISILSGYLFVQETFAK